MSPTTFYLLEHSYDYEPGRGAVYLTDDIEDARAFARSYVVDEWVSEHLAHLALVAMELGNASATRTIETWATVLDDDGENVPRCTPAAVMP